MKLSSDTQYSEEDIYQKAMDENWIGNGTLDNPYIIDSTHSFADKSVIKNSSLYILIKNCTFVSFILNRCKNLTFEQCTFEFLALSKSSKITLKNCSFKDSLELIYVNNSYIEDSFIPFLIFSMCYENHFKTCTVTRIYNHSSRANIFENINTTTDLYTILGTGSKTAIKKYSGLIAAGVISLISAIVFISYNYPDLFIGSLIGGIILIACFTILIPIALYLDYRTMRDYPDNQIF